MSVTTPGLHESLLALRSRKGRPLIMGILNVTPDSFYDGSRVPRPEDAVRRGLEMEQGGADLIDVGGESTRPGSEAVPAEEEKRRVLPVLEALAAKASVPLSIDTSKPETARAARDAGATVLNDVLALRADGMPEAARAFPVTVLMHMLGASPRTMQDAPRYHDVVGEVAAFLGERLEAFSRAGGDPSRAWIDPGIGFGKTLEHNIELLARLEELGRLTRPVLVGASRKSFIGKILGASPAAQRTPQGAPARPRSALEAGLQPGTDADVVPAPPELRFEGSLAVACRAAEAGAVCVRVHDVAGTRRALDVWARIRPNPPESHRNV